MGEVVVVRMSGRIGESVFSLLKERCKIGFFVSFTLILHPLLVMVCL